MPIKPYSVVKDQTDGVRLLKPRLVVLSPVQWAAAIKTAYKMFASGYNRSGCF
ncbi:MAG: hypothetical protein MR536_02105 [Prevotella sp.]|nr:hypothetical protein [Prevotella sp.]